MDFAWVGPCGLEVWLEWAVVLDKVGCLLSTRAPGPPIRGPSPRMNQGHRSGQNPNGALPCEYCSTGSGQDLLATHPQGVPVTVCSMAHSAQRGSKPASQRRKLWEGRAYQNIKSAPGRAQRAGISVFWDARVPGVGVGVGRAISSGTREVT